MRFFPQQRAVFRITCVLIVCGLVILDIAARYEAKPLSEAVPVSQLKSDGVPCDYATRVALVRSDDSALTDPVALDHELDAKQVHQMVFRALDLSGDLKPLLSDGAKITIKPNVVDLAEAGEGVTTDPRVVEAIILWMEKLGIPDLKYTVAEGGAGWLAPEMRDTPYNSGSAPVADGFEVAGYRQMIERIKSRGIGIELIDADFGSYDDPLSRIREVPVSDCIDFPGFESYWIHEIFLDADLLINVPVMKIHTTHITACLKNNIGLAAGAKYGTWKGLGGPNPGDPALHRDWAWGGDSVEREIVDLASIGRPQYNVVDAIVCKEREKGRGGRSVRRNMVLAGTDMVAIDSVCARLMGLNPHDVAHVTRAAREGLGTMDDDRITLLGEHGIEESIYYFEHPPSRRRWRRRSYGGRSTFGTSNHVWLLNSASGTDLSNSYLGSPDAAVVARASKDGWTEPIYFSDEFIDFEAYYGEKDDRTFYAFCWIEVPRDEEAELWIDHDEDCALWIGGEKVYERQQAYRDVTSLPGTSSGTIQLRKGRHPLLLKLVDHSGTAVFALNICQIVPSPLPEGKATFCDTQDPRNYSRYAGTRVFGLTFDLNGPAEGKG